jgi:hypothetical protein
LHFAHHDYAAADGFNSRRMEMQPAWTGGEAFLRGWAWAMRGWTKPRPAWRNTTSLPTRHRDRRVHAGAGEEGQEFSGFLNLRKRSWKRKNVNFLTTSPVHPALVLRVAGGGTTAAQAEDDLGTEEKRHSTVPVAGEGEVLFSSTDMFEAQMHRP